MDAEKVEQILTELEEIAAQARQSMNGDPTKHSQLAAWIDGITFSVGAFRDREKAEREGNVS